MTTQDDYKWETILKGTYLRDNQRQIEEKIKRINRYAAEQRQKQNSKRATDEFPAVDLTGPAKE